MEEIELLTRCADRIKRLTSDEWDSKIKEMALRIWGDNE